VILHWHRSKASRGQAGIFGLVWRTAAAVGGAVASASLFGDRRRRAIIALMGAGKVGHNG